MAGFSDESWRDSYDNWKLASPDDYYAEECLHEEYEADINGRATCNSCGEHWYLTQWDIERERELNVAFDLAMRREERRRRIADLASRLAFWRRWRKPPPIDDEIPF